MSPSFLSGSRSGDRDGSDDRHWDRSPAWKSPRYRCATCWQTGDEDGIMNQGSTGSRIAGDYPSILARMRELNAQSRQVAARVECDVCGNRGWVWSDFV